jgi:hypothetical protein
MVSFAPDFQTWAMVDGVLKYAGVLNDGADVEAVRRRHFKFAMGFIVPKPGNKDKEVVLLRADSEERWSPVEEDIRDREWGNGAVWMEISPPPD